MARVLHEVANLDGGGVARLIHDYYSHMDHDKIQFDFLINDDICLLISSMRLWCLAATRQHLIFTFLSYDCVSRFNSALRSGKLSCVFIITPCYIKRV